MVSIHTLNSGGKGDPYLQRAVWGAHYQVTHRRTTSLFRSSSNMYVQIGSEIHQHKFHMLMSRFVSFNKIENQCSLDVCEICTCDYHGWLRDAMVYRLSSAVFVVTTDRDSNGCIPVCTGFSTGPVPVVEDIQTCCT